MLDGLLKGILEDIIVACGACKTRAKTARADSTLLQVGQGQKLNPVDLSIVDLIRPLVIESIGRGPRRSVRAIPCLARALAPQPLR